MRKSLVSAMLGGLLLAGALGTQAEARSLGGTGSIGITKHVRLGFQIPVKKSIVIVHKPIYFSKPRDHRPVLFVGGTNFAGSCGFEFRKWKMTGLTYWKARYVNCVSIY